MNRFATRSALVLLAASTVGLAAFAQSADPQRGALLYENHCLECHTTEAHFRAARKSRSLADVRGWVARWQSELKLEWTDDEIEDVTGHLNTLYYQFPE